MESGELAKTDNYKYAHFPGCFWVVLSIEGRFFWPCFLFGRFLSPSSPLLLSQFFSSVL